MAMTTICISVEAYRRIKKLKRPGDSFSDVFLRELPEYCASAGELLDFFETHKVPSADPVFRAAMLNGRGRR